MEGLEKSDMITFTFKQDHIGCYVEHRVNGWEVSAKPESETG